MILNPNCSETVIRLKFDEINDLDLQEKEVYKMLLRVGSYYHKPTKGYSELRGDEEWKGHYYYQTVGNELVAFAIWTGLEFNTDEVWHCGDILSWVEEKEWNRIEKFLSEMFTRFEEYMLYPSLDGVKECY